MNWESAAPVDTSAFGPNPLGNRYETTASPTSWDDYFNPGGFGGGGPSRKRAVPGGPTGFAGAPDPVNGFHPTSDPNKNPGGTRAGPGYDEQFWQQNQDKWYQPTESDQYWNGIRGQFEKGPDLGGGVSKGYEDWFRAPDDVSRSEAYADAGGPQWAGYDTSGFASAAPDLNTNNLGKNIGNFVPGLGQRTDLERVAGAGGGAGLGRDSGAVFDRFFNPLSKASDSERLYGKDPGLGAYYDRAFETGNEQLDNAMAAKGLFGSGAAADETRQLAKDLGADRANREADYTLRAAGQSDAERRARMGLAGQLGSEADQNAISGANTRLNYLKGSADTMLGRSAEARGWSTAADAGAVARSGAKRDWADLLSGDELRHEMEARAGRESADRERTSRSTEARNWADLLDSGKRSDAATKLSYLTGGGALSNSADTTRLNYLESAMRGASTAENSQRNRENDAVANLRDAATAQGGAASHINDLSIDDLLKLLEGAGNSKLGAATNADNTVDKNQNSRDSAVGNLVSLYTGLHHPGAPR